MSAMRLSLLLPLCLLAGCNASSDLSKCLEGNLGSKTRIDTCTRAIAKATDPAELADAYHRRAEAHGELDNDEAAVADYGRALAREPDRVEALVARGWLLLGLDRGEEALADFAHVVRLEPDDGDAQFREVVALERTNQYAAALPKVERALFLYGDDAGDRANALGERCWIRAVLGVELDAALLDCDVNLAADDEDYNVMNSRGLVNYRLGNHADAIVDYTGAIEGDAEEASNWYMRGMARRALGETEAGDADIARALEIDPDIAKEYAPRGVTPVPPATAPAAADVTPASEDGGALEE
jgi:tetratricopeptide (TPR) repeat protein